MLVYQGIFYIAHIFCHSFSLKTILMKTWANRIYSQSFLFVFWIIQFDTWPSLQLP